MADHWRRRYAEAVQRKHQATSGPVRSVYSQLADHYLAMIRFTEGEDALVHGDDRSAARTSYGLAAAES